MKSHPVSELYEFLASRIDYEPKTGQMRWKNCEHVVGHLRGKKAGTVGKDGYVYLLRNKRVLAHRLAWLIHYGEMPRLHIDHINTIKSDNRICNMRLATIAENNRNKGASSRNSSGFKGVSFHKPTGKFAAKISVNRRTHCLGYFDSAEEASAAYGEAAKDYHGTFGRRA